MKTGTATEHRAIDNYINGNLSDAKRIASRYRLSHRNLMRVLMDDYGKSSGAAIVIADYLKGEGTFEAACKAEAAEGKVAR